MRCVVNKPCVCLHHVALLDSKFFDIVGILFVCLFLSVLVMQPNMCGRSVVFVLT